MHEYHIALDGLMAAPLIGTFQAPSDEIARRVAMMLFSGLSEHLQFKVTLVKTLPAGMQTLLIHTAPGGFGTSAQPN